MRRMFERAGFAAAVTVTVAVALFPIYWALVTSLESSSALFTVDYLPEAPAWENYRAVFAEQNFGRNLLNSLLVATTSVGLGLGLAAFAAHALARIDFRGRRATLAVFLAASMFPQVAVLTGLFELVSALGLYNRWAGLALTYVIFILPFSVWMLTAFMRELPREIEEAARLDGAGTWRLVTRVLLPPLAPAIATTGLLAFIAAWNEFLFALTLTLTDAARTAPVAIALISGASQYELPWGRMMAASLIVTAPLIALAILCQRRLVAGLTAGAVRG